MRSPENYFNEAGPIIGSGDVRFVNVEGCLQDSSKPRKTCSSNCYLFRSPKSYAQVLKDAGQFSLATLANNHARDFINGMEDSSEALEAAGIVVSSTNTAAFEAKGRSFKLVSFGFNAGMNSVRDIPEAVRLVKEASADGSIVIVSAHMGAEGRDALHVTKQTEIGFGENRGNPYAFAHSVIDAGADLVLGHGPHVPRAMELYKERLITYSMGNFATWYGMSVSGLKGLSMVVEAKLASDGAFIDGKIHSFKQSRSPDRPLKLDATHETARLVAKLTRQDLRGGGINIAADGSLSYGEELPILDCDEFQCIKVRSIAVIAQTLLGVTPDGMFGAGSTRALNSKLEELKKPAQSCLSACACKWLGIEH